LKIVVLAGGVGARLWPESRQRRPKQLLNLVGSRSMLQETVDRVLPLAAASDVYVVTGRPYVAAVAAQLPDLPKANVIGEPMGRGSAPAMGLAATYLAGDNHDVLAFLPADHAIAKPEPFRQALKAAEELAREGYLVTLGIQPSAPFTGYGYIQQGERIGVRGDYGGFSAFRVARFAEKPDQAAANAYLRSGQYSWNAGMFIASARTLLDEIALYLPVLGAQLANIAAARGARRERRVLREVWPQVTTVTVDYGIMEKTRRAAVIPVEIGWSDVGDWASLADALGCDSDGNVVRGLHLGLDTANCLIRGSGTRLIATIGLRDMVVVDAGDAILICPRERSQEAKQVVERLRADGREKYL
jgi:mannose-1-phosphate guanylyltransferase